MPLFISSECVSAHTPDNLSSKVVFPWSTWPTMPMLSSGCMSFSFISSDSFLMRGIFLLFLLFLFLSLGFCFLLFFRFYCMSFFFGLFFPGFFRLFFCFLFFLPKHV